MALVPPTPLATTVAYTFGYEDVTVTVNGPDVHEIVAGEVCGFVSGQLVGLFATVVVAKVEPPPETTRFTVNDDAAQAYGDTLGFTILHVTVAVPTEEVPATKVGIPGALQQNMLLPLPSPQTFPAGIGQSESEVQHLANERSA